MVKEFKYEMLIRRSKEIMKQYDILLTIRQVYYRLVAYQDIINNRSQYVYYDKVLTEYRQQHLDFADKFKDTKRVIIDNSEINVPYWEYSEIINDRIENVKTGYPELTYNQNIFQEKINVILLEKSALQGLFEKSITSNTILIVSSGLNSFTQMNDLRHIIENENRDLKFYSFTDFDDTGLFIEENFLFQMKEYLGIDFDSIERIGLIDKQIKKYNIPTDPTAKIVKQAKSTHKKYGLPYFVELDALEPNILMKLVKDTCEKNFDKELWKSVDKALTIRNRRIKIKYFKELKKIDLTKI